MDHSEGGSSIDLKFYGSTPLTDDLAFNVAAAYSNQDKGYGKNVFTGDDVLKQRSAGVQAKLKWSPGPNTDVSLRGFYNYNKSDYGVTFQILPGTVAADGTRPQGEYRTDTRRDPFAELTQYNINLKIDQGLGFATLTRHRGQRLTSDSAVDSRLPFGGGVGRADRGVGWRVGADRPVAAVGAWPGLPPGR